MVAAIDHAKEQAQLKLEHIRELLAAYHAANEAGNDSEDEAAREELQELPLELSIHSDWGSIGQPLEAAEYCILLCAGGSAVRIRGEFGCQSEPETVELEYQDWGTPWTRYVLNADEGDALLEFAQLFYWGD